MKEEAAPETFHDKAEALKRKFLDDIGETGAYVEDKKHHIVTQKQREEQYVESNYDKSSWQAKSYNLLEKLESFLVVLLAIDVVIVIIEIFLEAQFPTCTIIKSRELIFSCCPSETTENEEHRFLAGSHESDGSHGAHSLCGEGLQVGEFNAACDDHNESLHVTHEVFFALSVAILAIFEIENFLKIFILKSVFFKNFYYVLDLFVVSISLGLDIGFHVTARLVAELTSMLVIVRTWRLVRIIHGIYSETIKAQQEKEAEVQGAIDKYVEGIENLVSEMSAQYE